MASDPRCEFHINGICYEKVSHGFSERQLRENNDSALKPCNMGLFNGAEITDYRFCPTYKAFDYCLCQIPGTIVPQCCNAIRQAKQGTVDGEIIDLKTNLADLVKSSHPEGRMLAEVQTIREQRAADGEPTR